VPYIDTYSWFETKLKPLEGETYQAFMDRCVPAIMALQPELTPEDAKAQCESGWASCIMQNATKVTLTLTREFCEYADSAYLEGWFSDWKISEIHSAEVATLNITYSSVEKAKAGAGETFKIAKSNEDKQLVFGWANIAKDAEGNFPIDWDTDVTQPEDLEAAAYSYVLKYRTTGEKHEGEAVGQLVESVMFTKEKQLALGIPDGILPEGWWVGFHVADAEVFAKIKTGEYEMFSVQGSAKRLPTGM
jgi:hypothetical protein